MPKPLTLEKARALLGTLYPDHRITLEFRDNFALVYLNQDPAPHLSAPTWDQIIALATKELYAPTH